MNSSSIPRYVSLGRPGFSPELAARSGAVRARKRELAISVHFTHVHCTIETKEGKVHARPGDAILTGTAGERWRVSRRRFDHNYLPEPPTQAGEDGSYRSVGREIIAIRMGEEFEVLLTDGVSLLKGGTGDWLVDYGDGSLGVVSKDIFANTYEILS